MNPEQAWQSVLGQLQMEMPKASFDTWVRDTEVVSFEHDILTIRTRNQYARDWLESRLTSAVQRLLIGILNQSVSVQFVVGESPDEEPESDDEDEEPEVAIEPVQWLDYEKIVQPHKQVVVKGYLRRLGMEIGPKAVWLYIGFHQAAWMVYDSPDKSELHLHSRDVLRFSGLSFGAFWRSLRQPEVQKHLAGLVERLDPYDARRYRRGRDGRPHRIPIRYQVFMTPRLTRADASALYASIKRFLDQGASIEDALQDCLSVEDVAVLLQAREAANATHLFNTVMDIARAVASVELSKEADHLAQDLHRRIIDALGDIHITHFFISQVISQFGLTPAQAWLVTVSRDMAYLNWRTGERREVVTFKGGYQEMAQLIASNRPKTVQAWFNPRWTTEQRGGDLLHFMQEQETPEARAYVDLRVESMPRKFRVLLDEPLDADGSNKAGANGNNRVDADGSNSAGADGSNRLDASGSNMAGANGTVKSSLKHLLNTHGENTHTTEHGNPGAGAATPVHWELKTLLRRNHVHPKVQRELLEAQASVRAFVSWVLYTASAEGRWIAEPMGYAISRLREDPSSGAGGAIDQLAELPPKDLKALIDLSLSHPFGIRHLPDHPYASAWQAVMGSNQQSLKKVRNILYGKGEPE